MWNKDARFQIHWEPSDKCNAACPMCPRYTDDGFEIDGLVKKEWTLESFRKAFDEDFITRYLKKILACGNYGDPCACREFVDIYEYVRSVSPHIGLACNTNGSLRTPDWWRRLGAVMTEEQNSGNYCTFSIDGLEDTNHLYRRRTNFKKIMENAQAFIDAGGIAHWDFIVFEHNEHQVEEAKNLAIKMGFKNFNIKRTTRWKDYNENSIGSYPVYEKGEHIYDLVQPSEKAFQHNFEDATYFKRQNVQSITLDDFKNYKGKPNADRRFVNGKWELINLRKVNVACRSVACARDEQYNNEFYVSADGFIAPCCFLGSEPFRGSTRSRDENYLKMIDIDGGKEAFNVHNHDIRDILEKDLFKKMLPWSWKKKGNLDMKPKKCAVCCGVEWNNLDFGELGDKSNSYLDKDK